MSYDFQEGLIRDQEKSKAESLGEIQDLPLERPLIERWERKMMLGNTNDFKSVMALEKDEKKLLLSSLGII